MHRKKDTLRYREEFEDTKDRATRTPLKTGGELSRVNLVKKPIINREWGKDREVLLEEIEGVIKNGQNTHNTENYKE